VDECIDAYLKLSKDVFNVDQVLAGKIPVDDDQCRFDHNVLEGAIKSIIKERLNDEDCRMNAIPKTSNKICPTFVVSKKAFNLGAPPTIFRTYSGEEVRPNKCTLWQAARATSAAPSFFMPMFIDTPRPGIRYVDGGLGYNNPAHVALDEARRIWPTSKQFCLVSIGTGRPKAVRIVDTTNPDTDIESQRSLLKNIVSYIPNVVSCIPGWKTAKNFPPGVLAIIKMAGALASLATDSEDVHESLQRKSHLNDPDQRFPYFRFNVARDVGDIGLGDWMKAEELTTHTMGYMEEQESRQKKTSCVKCLINPPSFERK
jgi:predicted acylesterase/phospholipase RssA